MYGNRTHWRRCSHRPLVLKTRATTRCANTPEADHPIVGPTPGDTRSVAGQCFPPPAPRPAVPPQPPHPRGGRPFTDDRACCEGIVYLLRNGIRWQAMPRCYPSGVTCWRRHRDWTAAGVGARVWRVVLDELAEAGRLDTGELALDASFVEAMQGGTRSARRSAARA